MRNEQRMATGDLLDQKYNERDLSTDSLIDAYNRARRFNDCAAHSGRKRQAQLLSTKPGSRAEQVAADKLMGRYESCARNFGNIPVRFLRGSAAEVLAEKFITSDGLLSSLSLESLEARVPEAADDNDETMTFLKALAECQVSQSAHAVRTLLAKSVSVGIMENAEKELSQATSACGDGLGDNAVTNLLHRSFLAEAFYFSQVSEKDD
tara:strand:- start:450 stop:1073 length:624 start_codon:yes stop_codon:yes gene_type:complete